MRLEFALDLRYRTEAVAIPAASYELPDNASARMSTKALIRAGLRRWYRGQTTQTLDAVVLASVALPLHVRIRWARNSHDEILNPSESPVPKHCTGLLGTLLQVMYRNTAPWSTLSRPF